MDSAKTQEQSADTEVHRLESRIDEGSPPERVHVMTELATILSRSDATRARAYANRALELAQTHGYAIGLARAHQILAQINWKLGAHATAVGYAENAIRELEALGETAAVGRTHMVIGCVRINQSRLVEATESILTGRRLCAVGGDRQGEAIALDTLNVICTEQNDFEQGHQYVQESAKILEEIGDEYRLAISYINLGNYHQRTKDVEQALNFYAKGISILEEKEPRGYPIAGAHHNLGEVQKLQGRPDEALASLQRAYEIRKSAGDESGVLLSSTSIGQYFLELGDLESAEAYLTKSKEKAESLGLPKADQQASLCLSRVAEAKGEFERALRLHQHASKIQEQIYDEQQTRAISEMRTKYESERKEQEAKMDQLKYVQLEQEVARRRQAESALIQAQKLESLGVMAGGIAHDFNNMLHCVLGYTAIAAQSLAPNHPASHHIELAQKSGQQAADLAHQMLTYAGCRHYELRPCDINSVIESSSELIRGTAGSKLVLRFDLAPSLPSVRAEASQVHQIIANLVINAVEADAKRVRIATELRVLEKGKREFWALTPEIREAGTCVLLTVEDDGRGMEESVLSKIFDPFYSTKQTGKGLGLAAVLGILRGHRGGISVKSKVGSGSVFEFVFPTESTDAALSPVDPKSPPEKVDESQFQSRHILVIDDEQPVRELIATILGSAGYTVATATDGTTGILEFNKHAEDIDAVILDMTMPGMDALTIWQKLRERDPNVRIILMSGYDRSSALGQFGEDVAFLEKPYSPGELTATLDRTLQPLPGG